MPEVVVVRGAGGSLYEMDVPTAGHALERWNEQLAKGDIVIVTDPVEWVDDGQGARRLVAVEAAQEPAEAPKRRGRPPKAEQADTPAEADEQPDEE